MARLTLDGITKRFEEGDRPAVVDLSLEAADGELLVLVGPSGSGKTTVLRVVAGLDDPDEGSVLLDGVPLDGRPPKNRDVVMVFQDYALYPSMTVRENLGFGLRQSTAASDAEVEERVATAAGMLGIEDLLDRRPDELSGGQQQRVALGRAIVRNPAVFLMDEPLSNLDARLSDRMRTEISRIQRRLDTTTLYVTHDQSEAMTLGDRIAVLRDGRLQQVGEPQACYAEPANRFVAGFLGDPSMTFFECERRDDRLVAGDVAYPLPPDARAAVGAAGRVTLGVRPADVEFVGEVTAPREFAATVETVEPVGSRKTLHLAPRGEVPVAADRKRGPPTVTATVSGATRVETGRTVGVRLPDAAHLFDADTGAALYHPPREGTAGDGA
ncbi:MAG: ABC transporter ATP-binding protein [Haloferacaceae archaeon]